MPNILQVQSNGGADGVQFRFTVQLKFRAMAVLIEFNSDLPSIEVQSNGVGIFGTSHICSVKF